MAQVTVKKASARDTRLFQKAENTFDAIRKRAFELFEQRGTTPGHEVEDWTRAEREFIFASEAEITETAAGYSIRLNAPGFETKNLTVEVSPEFIIVAGPRFSEEMNMDDEACRCEFTDRDLLRRFAVPPQLDTRHVKAVLENGVLTVTAPKSKAAVEQFHAAA